MDKHSASPDPATNGLSSASNPTSATVVGSTASHGPGTPNPSSQASAFSTSSRKQTRTSRLPTNVIQPASFFDTMSLLLIFCQIPSAVMLIVHGLFLTSWFSHHAVTPLNVRNIFGWTTGSASSSRTSQSSNLLVAARVILIDMFAALVTLYVTPMLRTVVMIFAHASVSSALGGGGPYRVFYNAVYATLFLELFNFVWDQLHGFWSLDGILVYSSSQSSSSRYHNHHHSRYDYGASLLSSGYVTDGIASVASSGENFNTLTGLYSLLSKSYRFLLRLDWTHELPQILFQMLAIHVCALGSLPFLRRILPDGQDSDFYGDSYSFIDVGVSGHSISSQSSSSAYGVSSSSSSTSPYSTLANGESTTASQSSNVYPSSSGLSPGPADNVNTSVISVPSQSHQKHQSLNVPSADLDFLYSPSIKKNKRLATVRANQPLWTTLASSIVLAARQESGPQNIQETKVSEFPHTLPDISVRYILSNLVAFKVVGEKTRTFSVIVNGVQWLHVAVQPFDESSSSDINTNRQQNSRSRKELELRDADTIIIVYGLSPLAQYEIEVSEVLNSPNGEESSVTRPCMKIDICTLTSSNGSRDLHLPPARSSSPVSTLLETLTTTQMTLSEEKLRLKKVRKDHSRRLTQLRSEIDSLKMKIESADKGDGRTTRKVLSLRGIVRQLEDEIEHITTVTQALSESEEDSITQYESTTTKFELFTAELAAKEEQWAELKDYWANRTDVANSELNQASARFDKLVSKHDLLCEEREKAENELDNAIQRHSMDRADKRQRKQERRQKLEEEFSSNISHLERVTADLVRRTDMLQFHA